MDNSNKPTTGKQKLRELVLYGVSQSGHTTHANDAVAKESYTCPHCRARIHLTHRNDKKFFACYPSEKHTGAMCRSGSTMHDIKLTNPDDLFSGFYSEEKPQGPGKGGFGPTKGPRDDVFPCTSLKHIYESGIFNHPAKDDRLGNYHVGKIILTKAMLPAAMQEKRSLLNRIIYALPDHVDYKRRTIRFVVIHNIFKDDRRFKETMRFLVPLGNHHRDFQHFRNKLFDANGKPIPQPVLIVAEWHFVLFPDCSQFCGKTHCKGTNNQCMGLQIGTYHCKKQIYIPELENRNEKKPSDGQSNIPT